MRNRNNKDGLKMKFGLSANGLPVLRKPEWTDVKLGEHYRLTVSVLGDHIILIQPVGYAELSDTKNGIKFVNNIIDNFIETNSFHIQLLDCANFSGVSLEGRKYYIKELKNKKLLLGLIFFDISPFLNLSIKLAKHLNITNFNVEIVHCYSDAVERALKLLYAEKTKINEVLDRNVPQPSIIFSKKKVPHDIGNRPVWFINKDDYSARLEIIDGCIFHWSASGFFSEKYIAPTFEINDEAFSRIDHTETNFYFILGVTELTGSTRKARKLYIDRIKEWQRHHPFEMFIFYGANRFFNAAINLASPFAPFKVRIAKDLDGALKLIAKQKLQIVESTFQLTDKCKSIDQANSSQIKQYAEGLLQYLGSIDWETYGLDNVKKVDPSHPFSSVFDAINVIKSDIDELHQERRHSEEESNKLKAKIQQAQKMEAIGALVGGVAHDLNNILSGLVSYPELLLMDMPPDSPLKEPILTIKKSGEKAAAIVQDMLTLARRGVTVNDVVNINDIIVDYVKSAEYSKLMSFHKDVHINTSLETNLFNIMGSPFHLFKAIMNLASNAAEAMPKGGDILISTENKYIDNTSGYLEDIKEGEYVILSVSDTGIGISPEDVVRIFEPFYTKKIMGRSGTGLGMAVVWGTIKDHNGYIDVQSKEGKGTSFTLYFPVTRKEKTRDQPLLPIDEYMGKGESVLVVDDVKEQRQIATRMLRRLGYQVSSVSSGEEAIEYMKNNSADLILLDMIMDPGINGREAYERIIKLHPNQKAVIVSGFSETDDFKVLRGLGVGKYIKKPYTLEKIGTAIRDELKK